MEEVEKHLGFYVKATFVKSKSGTLNKLHGSPKWNMQSSAKKSSKSDLSS